MMIKGTKALEIWCQRATSGYPNVNVVNMSSSWKDGLAFCALVHHYRPDLLDFDRLDPSDIRGNNSLAFRLAQEHFNIPSLLDPEDMVSNRSPDRLSILTYVSEFYHKLKDVEPRASPNRQSYESTALSRLKSKPFSRTLSRSSSSGISSDHSSSCASSISSGTCDSPPPPPVKIYSGVRPGAIQSLIIDQKCNDNSRSFTSSEYVESKVVSRSPAVESDNPFRQAMLMFLNLEEKSKRLNSKKISKSTETVSPITDSKSTQTTASQLARRRTKKPDSSSVSGVKVIRTPSVGQSLHKISVCSQKISSKYGDVDWLVEPAGSRRPISQIYDLPSSDEKRLYSQRIRDQSIDLSSSQIGVGRSSKTTIAPSSIKHEQKKERHLVGLYNHQRISLHVEGASSLV